MSMLRFAQFGSEAELVRQAARATSLGDVTKYVENCWRAAVSRVHHAPWDGFDDKGWLTFAREATDRDVAAIMGGDDHDELVAVDGPADRNPERVEVLDRDEQGQRLRLARKPRKKQLRRKANVKPLRLQNEALAALATPLLSDRPLLRLCEPLLQAQWPDVTLDEEPTWQELKDGTKDGTDEQRRFVQIALATPDFAVLEGPPGSGKTTAIVELVLQQVRRGKRVLLCASTHVAVDNVLERLAKHVDARDGDVFPIRFGRENKVSNAAQRFHIDNVVDAERQRMRQALLAQRPLTAAQLRLRAALDDKDGTLAAAIVELSNVVCGTTIGILELNAPRGAFDMLILDEASKTTFQEFLVPALRAQRWVVVGDRCQLSPFVDQDDVATNLAANVHLSGSPLRAARTDVLGASAREPVVAVVATSDASLVREYQRLGNERGIAVADAAGATDDELGRADIVIGANDLLVQRRDALPIDSATLRDVRDDVIKARHRAHHDGALETPRWEHELAWRLADEFALRLSDDTQTRQRRKNEAAFLTLPQDNAGVARVRRVAFPSILELLESGLDAAAPSTGASSALSAGLPRDDFNKRRVRLRFQWRMDEAIAALPQRVLYSGADGRESALLPAAGVDKRTFGYHRRGCFRVVVNAGRVYKNVNRAEVHAVCHHVEEFVAWARANPREDRPWEVAVLSFYSAQERELRSALRSLRIPRGVTLEVCTVDRFQGHEADVVALSFVQNHATSFLQSRNRLNVALTRARHLRLTFAHPNVFRPDEPLLAGLGKECSIIGGAP